MNEENNNLQTDSKPETLETLDEPTTEAAPVEPTPVESPVEAAPVESPVEVAPVEPTPVEPAPEAAPVPQEVEAQKEEPTPVVPVENTSSEGESKPPKKNNLLLPIIIGVVVLLGVGAFLFFGTDMFKSKEKGNNEEKPDTPPVTVSEVDKFVGIYAAENDKMYIRKENDKQFHYMIGGNFEGYAIVTGDTAKQRDAFDDDHFEFKIVDGGIELTYITTEENVEVAADTGKYTKIAEYTSDNLYKEAVGDPTYLDTEINGIFKNGEIELYIYQINEKEIMVETLDTSDVYFSEKFELEDGGVYSAKSFFDESKNAYTLVYSDNSIDITVYDDVFGFDEENKKLEAHYSFGGKITKEEILEKFYRGY